ncbi:MAG: hypothetical protein L6435_03265 [Anaerolineae bacterium]|nr:hypothetical protein [Anaerolineae bacterium]
MSPSSDFTTYLPVVYNNCGGCPGIVTLIGPPNGASLDNIIPMFSWDAGAHPNSSTALHLHIATNPDFTVISKSYQQ